MNISIKIKTCVCSVLIFCIFILLAPADATANRRHRVRSDRTIETVGDITQLVVPFSAFAYSLAIGDDEGLWQWTQAVGCTIIMTQILKYAIGEERPNQPEDSKGDSFPSGHASFAFSGAAYWQRRYGWKVGIPMYAAASYVAYSRVYAYKHNWFDVLAGAAIGYGFNFLFTSAYIPDGVNIAITPTNGGARLDWRIPF